MTDTLPTLRSDIDITVQEEDNEAYLVLFDALGFAEGPIMIHSSMVDVIEACNGVTTWSELAARLDVEPDSTEIFRLRVYLGQLDEMGYMEGAAFEQRRSQSLAEWNAQSVRQPVCSGSVYPADPHELRHFLDVITEKGAPCAAHPHCILMPHIDFRVTTNVYADGFRAIADSDASCAILIGTSHYWSEGAYILTDKNFETPLGVAETNQDLVRALRQALPGVCHTDIAHRPEHSLELHIVALQHAWARRPFTIVPILVTPEAIERGGADEIARIVEASGRPVIWLISGDLAHVGMKFGDSTPAADMLDQVRLHDTQLLNALSNGNVEEYHRTVSGTQNAYRICGHAPTVVGLQASRSGAGTVHAYDVWHEEPTQSAVSFATVTFGKDV